MKLTTPVAPSALPLAGALPADRRSRIRGICLIAVFMRHMGRVKMGD